jgi:integrase
MEIPTMTRFEDVPTAENRLEVASQTATLADLIPLVEADPNLGTTRRRDLKSAISTFCRCLHLLPGDASATMLSIARRIDGVHPVQLGLTEKRWQNILSELRFAIGRYGPRPVHAMRTADLPEPWSSLSALLPAPGLRYGLSRLIKFCATSGIAPDTVDASTFDAFELWLQDNTLCTNPRRKAREAARQWNRAVKSVQGWPEQRVELAPALDAYCLAWEEFPETFRKDAEAWLASLKVDCWHDESAPLRPLKASSIETRRFQIRQAASVLVRQGVALDSIASLADLVEPDRVVQVLSFFWERNGKKPSSQAAGIAHCLLAIARHRVKLPEVDLDKLRRLKRRVTPRQSGLTPKNRETLRQFEDDLNKERLLMFPVEAMNKAIRMSNRAPEDAALLAQTAVAVEILVMMPLRLNNLANLHLDRHLEWRGERLFVIIPAESVKNDEPIEFELPADSIALLQTYRERFRPLLDNGTAYLFPGKLSGRPKNRTHLSRHITRTLKREIGIQITPHQFRHVAAKIWLDDNPGSYEVIRRVLHHRSVETTTKNYTGFETCSATRQYDAFILDQRRRFLGFREDEDAD